MTTTYIHGQIDPREVARLEKQADFVAPFFFPHLAAAPGERVLDLATGVGAMAARLVERYPGIRLVGLDMGRAQLETARRNHPVAAYVQGNGTRMPFRDGAFDKVYCSWMLEHVPSPLAVLREVHRVLRPGGACLFLEVDNSSFRTQPVLPEAMEVLDALNKAQVRGGGDPWVGRKLSELLHAAGFAQVDARPVPMRGSAADPALFRKLVEEFAEIFEGLDEALGPAMDGKIRAAVERLRALPGQPGAEVYYCGFIGRAVKLVERGLGG